MGTYCRGTKEDLDELIDLANMVFSMSSGSVDFEKLLPKAYSTERNMLAAHHLIKENDRIKALIDVLPIELKMGEESIKAGYVGTVSVHPKARGKKYMITLMEEMEAQQRIDGTDILILDGNRHRYQHYGFERAGLKYCFNITSDSIRHCCNTEGHKEKEYSFELIHQEDEERINTAFALYQKRKVTARKREDFYLCLRSWEADTYAVLAAGKCIGYLNVSADEGNVFEAELEEISELPFVIRAFMTEFGIDELGMNIGMDEVAKLEILDRMSDYYTVNTSHLIKILNYEKVLHFLFAWKLTALEDTHGMQEGSFVIGVCSERKDRQDNYALKYKQGKVLVEKTDLEADVVLEEKELVKTLTTSYYFHVVQKPDSPFQNAPKGWFPLPFFLPEGDAF